MHRKAEKAGENPLVRRHGERLLVLAGNPNVGKSTLFNALTGLHQHTGNWPGKTVGCAQGSCTVEGQPYRLIDTPGTYSLLAHSAEEEIARDCLCFGDTDSITVVCDATCLERNLGLVLQAAETGRPVTVCVNLMDEARRKRIAVDIPALEQALGLPVVPVSARRKKTLSALTARWQKEPVPPSAPPVRYPTPIEAAISRLEPLVEQARPHRLPLPRWTSLRLLENDPSILGTMQREWGPLPEGLGRAVAEERDTLAKAGYTRENLTDAITAAIGRQARQLAAEAVRYTAADDSSPDRRIDRVITNRWVALPLMAALLCLVLWLTVVGANYPSQWLSDALFRGQEQLTRLCGLWGVPDWLHGALVLGVYRVLAWVIGVMLPPMAIFFPLFTLLEDIGYLPRIAYTLDRPFEACRACGKQALTMCMGFGCNAAGVVGCRIIDSPRERLLAILTNSLVPCNGRFPTLITLITLFFVGTTGMGGLGTSLQTAILLTLFILLGVGATLLVTRLLAATVLKGAPSAFTLELPPYRPPQVGQILVRSLLDRTLFVLGRAVAVAAPAGLLIWLLGNVTVGGTPLLTTVAGWLEPVGSLLGMDGAILLAFILGLPANEIVVPLILMIYLAEGTLPDADGMHDLLGLLTAHGWTWHTAASTALFSLFHWPCSTTLLTVKKETGSLRWTALAALLPTAIGVLCCLLLKGAVTLWG